MTKRFTPPEWAPHDSCWLAWPTDKDLWDNHLEGAQAEFLRLCQAIADVDEKSGTARGEHLNILVNSKEALVAAKHSLSGVPATFHMASYGDIWLRDTAPIFVLNEHAQRVSLTFAFNGWGEKYILDGDVHVASQIANFCNTPIIKSSLVLEGGALEFDGEGTLLTTRSCLLNKNRNPELSESKVEAQLKDLFGVEKVLWLDDGLKNDHTDGHIDTLARFIAPGKVLCMEPDSPKDPNYHVLIQIKKSLSEMTDAKGRKLEVMALPSPGKVLSSEGEIMPASYMNYYIANTTVAVPTYGTANDENAVSLLQNYFTDRKVVGCPARTILEGGGAFHCITQQEPKKGVLHG